MLDTVAEESENDFKHLSIYNELTVTGDKGSLEDEVTTVLIRMLVEFLSNEPKMEGDVDVAKKEIESIIEYLEKAIGIGEKSFSLGREGLNKLR